MIVVGKSKTWDNFTRAIREAFQWLTNQNTREHYYEFRYNPEAPTCSKLLDYLYPSTLVEVRTVNKAWWNLWKGRKETRTLMEIGDDWGGAFKVVLTNEHRDSMCQALKRVEENIGIAFEVEFKQYE